MIDLWHQLITSLPFGWAQYSFMHNALLAVLVISPVFAWLGCLVVNNQMAFYSEAVGHAALTGIGIGVLLGLTEPLWAMIGFSVVLALGVTVLRQKSAASSDTILGLTMSFTVALGVVMISKGGNFAKYSRYLIGDLLTLTNEDLSLLLGAFTAVALIWVVLFNRIFFVTANHALARSRGFSVWITEAVFAVMIALVVTISIPLLGLLVINSLLVLPAAAARNVARNTPQYLAASAAFSTVSGICGLLCSFYWGTATGATIVLFAMGIFLICAVRRER